MNFKVFDGHFASAIDPCCIRLMSDDRFGYLMTFANVDFPIVFGDVECKAEIITHTNVGEQGKGKSILNIYWIKKQICR